MPAARCVRLGVGQHELQENSITSGFPWPRGEVRVLGWRGETMTLQKAENSHYLRPPLWMWDTSVHTSESLRKPERRQGRGCQPHTGFSRLCPFLPTQSPRRASTLTHRLPHPRPRHFPAATRSGPGVESPPHHGSGHRVDQALVGQHGSHGCGSLRLSRTFPQEPPGGGGKRQGPGRSVTSSALRPRLLRKSHFRVVGRPVSQLEDPGAGTAPSALIGPYRARGAGRRSVGSSPRSGGTAAQRSPNLAGCLHLPRGGLCKTRWPHSPPEYTPTTGKMGDSHLPVSLQLDSSFLSLEYFFSLVVLKSYFSRDINWAWFSH